MWWERLTENATISSRKILCSAINQWLGHDSANGGSDERRNEDIADGSDAEIVRGSRENLRRANCDDDDPGYGGHENE